MYIKLDNQNKVIREVKYFPDNKDKTGWIEIDYVPEFEYRDGYSMSIYYINDEFTVEYEIIPEPEIEENIINEAISYKDLVVKLIREKYTIDDELAIHRQRSDKFSEFYEYDKYCEQCKVEAKRLLGIYED